jgi:Fe-S-cluster containining protein
MMGERERRRLRRRGERMLEHGLRLPVQRDDLVDALLLLDDRFTSSPSEGRAVQLAADALTLFDATLRRNPFVHELACKKDCSYCCYTYASVTAPEALLAARKSRESFSPAALGELLERAAETQSVQPNARVGRKIPCAFLDRAACSIYAVRPIPCRLRSTLKEDLGLCIQEFEGGTLPVRQTALHQDVGFHVTALIQVVLAANGHAIDTYELSGSIRVALTIPDAELRWLSGEDVFAPVLKDGLSPHHGHFIRQQAAWLARTRGTRSAGLDNSDPQALRQ